MQTVMAKVFISGGSQTIRLPEQFRLDTDEVFISKSGNSLILTPCTSSWEGFIEGFSGFSTDFTISGEMSADVPRKTFP
ncbi:MAG: type II toxin-antitoxin system VapB family antitoxin [Magnetococcus sp. DMHC-1]